ncbi:YopJ/AvrA family T3SS effector serine/threonine acetyltransferase [Pseudovibrio brasiliensis]|uniref:Effector protein YopJ n=1 Tax=Pseudovibrio brasiliensis TaxID=1898042 RepID=A0ABX8AKU6_9HYPH|nr:YopJ/AvrA family T3SS effector serine/threonine acetyltransferase [Pseudovibrio brasiliensis]QUS55272.1 effector protein YopJ [Pseudovibrio brasiliensis]
MLNQVGNDQVQTISFGSQHTDVVPDDRKSQIETYLHTIHEHLENGKQLPSNSSAPTDKKFMNDLVGIANSKKEGLNAQFCSHPAEMAQSIKEMIANNQTSARFIVNMGGGIHFAAFDFAMVDGKPSVIGVEPATMNSMGPAMLAIQTKSAFETHCPDVKCVTIESDLQRSNGECGIFSLAIAKKMLKEGESFHVLHEKNLVGALPENNYGFVTAKDSDDLLPPLLMKHAQSEKRLDRYLAAHPEHTDLQVNKKGETLKERQTRHVVDVQVEDKTIHYSNSIEHKREAEIRALFDKV